MDADIKASFEKLVAMAYDLRHLNTTQLIAELKILCSVLQSIQQSALSAEALQELVPVALALLQEQGEEDSANSTLRSKSSKFTGRLVDHSDRAVRLLAAVCTQHMLRLFAPNAPYNPLQLQVFFKTVVQQMSILTDTRHAYFSYAFALVEGLATFKSIALVLDVPESDQIQYSLFKSCFDLITNSSIQSSPIRTHLLDLVQTVLEEGGSDLSIKAVDHVLSMLHADQPMACQEMARTLITTCAPIIGTHLASSLNTAFATYCSGTSSKQSLSNLKTVHQKIAAVSLISNDAVFGPISLLEDELISSSVDARQLALETLGSVFQSFSDAPRKCSSAFAAFSARCDDKSTAVRITWTRIVCSLLTSPQTIMSATSRLDLAALLADRLLDEEIKVRERSILLITEAALNDSHHFGRRLLSDSICSAIIDRCRDRAEDVRLAALNCCCALIVHLQRHQQCYNNSSFDVLVRGLFALMNTADRDLRIYYEYFVEHSLFLSVESSSIESFIKQQANLLVAVFSALDYDDGQKALARWLASKARFAKYMAGFIQLIRQDNRDQRLKVIVAHLASLFRIPNDAANMFQALSETVFAKDLSTANGTLPTGPIGAARRFFERIVDPSLSVAALDATLRQASELDWITSVDARIQPYLVTFVGRRASMLSISSELLAELASRLSVSDSSTDASSIRIQSLIEHIMSAFPHIGLSHAALLQTLILQSVNVSQDTHQDIVLCKDQMDCNAFVSHMLSFAQFMQALSGKVSIDSRLIDLLDHLLFENPTDETNPFGLHVNAKIIKAAVHIRCFAQQQDEYWQQRLLDNDVLFATDFHQRQLIYWTAASQMAKLAPNKELYALIDPLLSRLDQSFASSIANTTNLLLYQQIKALTRLAIHLRSTDRMKHSILLQKLAPMWLKWIRSLDHHEQQSAKLLQSLLIRSLARLIPHPSISTIHSNLSAITETLGTLSTELQSKYCIYICKHYLTGHLGMMHLVLALVSLGYTAHSYITSTFRNDHRFASDPIDANSKLEITSTMPRRWEQLFVLSLVLAPLLTNAVESMDSSAEKSLVSFLVQLMAKESNVSMLFDAVVQLKCLVYTKDIPNATQLNKQLYCLSEWAQTALRQKASQHKWPLQSISFSIHIVDSVLESIAGEEETLRNIKRSYLVADNQKMQMDTSENAENRMVSN